MTAITTDESSSTKKADVSLLSLYFLRAGYLFWAVGLAFKNWPRFFPVDLTLPVMNTVVNCVLVGLS
ncbi:MAG TPA: hypothetical protein VK629_05575, partial [Steroidobacteraceae bacterium]|nr:hypothetical protein [Steroidobacteraceae bacterium]